MREQMETENKEGLVLERSPWGKTGFVNVIKVKGGKFQASSRLVYKYLENVEVSALRVYGTLITVLCVY